MTSILVAISEFDQELQTAISQKQKTFSGIFYYISQIYNKIKGFCQKG